MTKLALTRACAAGALFACGLIVTAGYSQGQPAAAGAGASSSTSIISQGYFEQAASATNCTHSTSCLVSFAAAPAGKLMVVNHVSCHLNVPANVVLTSLYLIGQVRPTYLTPVLIGTAPAGNRFLQSSNEVVKLVQSPNSPIVVAAYGSSASTELSCLIAGLIKP